jgi:hypothetical protein
VTGYLPKLELARGAAQSHLTVGAADFSFPRPDREWLGNLGQFLRAQHRKAAERPVAEALAVLDSVNTRWADPSSLERKEADELLAATAGYPREVIRPALDHLFSGLRAAQLTASLAEELGDGQVLDTWIERPILGTRSRAYGPRLTLVVASGNVPMAAIPTIVFALLLKSPVLVKLSSDEPVLAGLYLRSLAAIDETLGQNCAAVWWPGGD